MFVPRAGKTVFNQSTLVWMILVSPRTAAAKPKKQNMNRTKRKHCPLSTSYTHTYSSARIYARTHTHAKHTHMQAHIHTHTLHCWFPQPSPMLDSSQSTQLFFSPSPNNLRVSSPSPLRVSSPSPLLVYAPSPQHPADFLTDLLCALLTVSTTGFLTISKHSTGLLTVSTADFLTVCTTPC